MDVPKNIFLSWGAARGDFAVDGDFVNFWKLSLGSKFMKKNIEVVASDILQYCKGGKNYMSLDPRKGLCRGGVWFKKGHLPAPTNIVAQQQQTLVKECIKFAARASKSKTRNENLNDALLRERS